MTQEEKIKCSNMFGVAKTYKESAELLDGANQVITSLAGKQGVLGPFGRKLNFDHVILARIVLYGISIEILLKSLFVADNVATIRSHDWVSLFQALPAARQTEIKDAMRDDFKADFETLLSKNKDTFIKWRYSYEETNLSCDITFVNNLADVLVSIVIKLVN